MVEETPAYVMESPQEWGDQLARREGSRLWFRSPDTRAEQHAPLIAYGIAPVVEAFRASFATTYAITHDQFRYEFGD